MKLIFIYFSIQGESKSNPVYFFADFSETAVNVDTKFYTFNIVCIYVSMPNKSWLTSTTAK